MPEPVPTATPPIPPQNQKTPQEVQQWFREQGLTIAHWAAEHGFNAALTYAVVGGRRACLRGQSHEIAVALGLKPTRHA